MTVPDQFFDLAHPAAEMAPAAGPHAALDGLVTEQAVADLDGCHITGQALQPISFCSPLFRLSRLIRTHKTSHRFSFAICLGRPKRLIVKEGRGGDHPLFAIGDHRRAGKFQSWGNAS
ncbi:hypothetical protein RlegWSM1455_09230 [Rhizobium laguerreae]|uniref:Uncharacterized protein n=1 Tax=Rhizobium laguerreae TaxID=1076926 RepID=A0ABR6GB02_9HYPH|nr:hypothetical protein [Rhizobium laguerreae]MBB3163463.1 hypothetical protein [Rhizobium laguerreae]UFW66952.1 hypothetical protein RlegWSM1455_09230 [Rhizobium laguerreae]